MNKLPSLQFLERLNGAKTASERETAAPFIVTMRSPADSMQFVALKWPLGRSGKQKLVPSSSKDSRRLRTL